MPLGISDADDSGTDAQTDARREWVQLRAFQRDCLIALGSFQAVGDAPKGLEILDFLEAERGLPMNHGRLYPNLDDLVADGLVGKGSKDARTNEYRLTTRGREVLRAGSRRFPTVDGGNDE